MLKPTQVSRIPDMLKPTQVSTRMSKFRPIKTNPHVKHLTINTETLYSTISVMLKPTQVCKTKHVSVQTHLHVRHIFDSCWNIHHRVSTVLNYTRNVFLLKPSYLSVIVSHIKCATSQTHFSVKESFHSC